MADVVTLEHPSNVRRAFRALLDARGVTLAAAARGVGVSAPALSSWAGGKYKGDNARLDRLVRRWLDTEAEVAALRSAGLDRHAELMASTPGDLVLSIGPRPPPDALLPDPHASRVGLSAPPPCERRGSGAPRSPVVVCDVADRGAAITSTPRPAGARAGGAACSVRWRPSRPARWRRRACPQSNSVPCSGSSPKACATGRSQGSARCRWPARGRSTRVMARSGT